MSNPYYRVTLTADVRLHPSGMNNNISDNIRKEAENRYNHKCFLNYGYIDGIYKITENGAGVIQSADPTSSGLFTVDMECRMLIPIVNDMIYATITGINEKMIVADSGTLKIMIQESLINRDNIRYIKNAYYQIDSNGKPIGAPINEGSLVVIKLLATKIVPKQKFILGIGILESAVDPNEYDKIHTTKKETIMTIDEIEVIRKNRPITTTTDSVIISPMTSETKTETKVNMSRAHAQLPAHTNIQKHNSVEHNNDGFDEYDTLSPIIISDSDESG